MKDNDYVMIFGVKIEKGLKSPMKMVQNQKSDEYTNTKKKKDVYDFVEKTMLEKEQQKDLNEEASKAGATIDNMDDSHGIGATSRYKRVHESTSKPPKEDVGTSLQQNDIVQSPSQVKRQKMALGGNSRPPATQPPTKASALRLDPLNFGNYDELQRLIIIPDGLGFYPSDQPVKAMVESMCSCYSEPWRYWKDVPLNIRERMFDGFKMKCTWSLEHDTKIRETFFRKCSRKLNLLWYARKHDNRPSWIREDIWKSLNEYWASPKFKKNTVKKEAQTSVVLRSPQPSEKEE